MARRDGNYSGWADHRTFMNIAFAQAVKATCEAVKSVDKEARGDGYRVINADPNVKTVTVTAPIG